MIQSPIYARIACLVIALFLGACASAPNYVPADDIDDVGHYSTRLDDDRYRIVYNGRTSTHPDTTRDYALLRAAEITLGEGYDWFEVVDRETSAIRRSRPSTSVRHERAYYVERDCGLLACQQSVRPVTTTSVGFDSDRETRTRYSHALEIVMGKGRKPAGGQYYEADSVARSLWASI